MKLSEKSIYKVSYYFRDSTKDVLVEKDRISFAKDENITFKPLKYFKDRKAIFRLICEDNIENTPASDFKSETITRFCKKNDLLDSGKILIVFCYENIEIENFKFNRVWSLI